TMQGRKDLSPKIMYQVHLDMLVSQDNFYRKLDAALNLHFLYKATSKYYGSEGNESIDPVVFFKIILVGYFNNINSDRQLLRYCSNCLDVRLFLRYDIDEELPWFSTISRTRQLYGEEVFITLFKKILSLCVDKGMVRGKRQAIDSAFIKANASLDSLIEKEITDDAQAYADELNEGSEEKIMHEDKAKSTVTTEKKKQIDQHHAWKAEAYQDQPCNTNSKKVDEQGNLIRPKFLSNYTHHSPTDPDARISVKPGKARQLNYFGQVAVDDAHHVITGACADFADKRDSQCMANILDLTQENLADNNIALQEITADTGYSSGEVLKYLKEKNVDAYIPNFGQYIAHREGFIYNQEKDQYECQRGKKAILPCKGERSDRKGYHKKTYRSSESVCKDCPLRVACCGKSTKFKKIEDSIHKPLYDVMHKKMQTPYAKQMGRIRSKTVEPVLGTLLNFMNMKRVNTRGIRQANKHVIMAALAYNLKKYLRFESPKVITMIKQMELLGETTATFSSPFLCFVKSIMASPFFRTPFSAPHITVS
ncbi:MAG: IS1182 family transposase, partial [Bacteroidota bacterium]